MTRNDVHLTRGSKRLAAAKNTRSAKDGQLVAQHHDFQFPELDRTEPESDELQDALKDNIAERDEHDAPTARSFGSTPILCSSAPAECTCSVTARPKAHANGVIAPHKLQKRELCHM